MNNKIKIIIIFIALATSIFVVERKNIISFYIGSYSVALADDGDDEEEEDEDEDENDDEGARVINTSSDGTEKKTETVTTYVKLSDTVSKQVETTTKYDSDGDGIFDEVDPHPTINEAYIVIDANQDGIVDSYE